MQKKGKNNNKNKKREKKKKKKVNKRKTNLIGFLNMGDNHHQIS